MSRAVARNYPRRSWARELRVATAEAIAAINVWISQPIDDRDGLLLIALIGFGGLVLVVLMGSGA